jgi:chemotaxis protein CheY-P-specific phosphatase CheC/ActR/RegA family two-component response regulator
MPTSLLICDDSTMARKQVARSLPDCWDVDVTFATDGVEAIAAIKVGKGDILLLDLNMPKMDGYQVLEAILKQDLPTLTIVISGDIQPEAHQRVKGLGALDFIKKPVDKSKLTEVLSTYGVFSKEDLIIAENEAAKLINQSIGPVKSVLVRKPTVAETQQSIIKFDTEMFDCYQEITNVAMGKAGNLLARLLDVVVVLPIPNVNLIEVSELTMALSDVENKDETSGICQGFIGAGISGEALLIVNDSSFKDIASLMKYEHKLDSNVELELLMDMANLLIGACLSGIAEQLDMSFSQGHPVVLCQHRKISELIATNTNKWKKTLAIEISYSIENYPIKFDLLLLFTEQSLAVLNHKIAYLLD